MSNPSIRRTRPSPASRLPSCAQNFYAQSLVNSRTSLALTFQRIGQRGNSYRLPAARIRLPFARCPCTKPAICAGAVNHPHHNNHVNHSSDKCQPALVHALIPVNPFHRPNKTTRAAFASLPPAVLRPKFLAQSHTILSYLVSRLHLACISPACQPLHPPQKCF